MRSRRGLGCAVSLFLPLLLLASDAAVPASRFFAVEAAELSSDSQFALDEEELDGGASNAVSLESNFGEPEVSSAEVPLSFEDSGNRPALSKAEAGISDELLREGIKSDNRVEQRSTESDTARAERGAQATSDIAEEEMPEDGGSHAQRKSSDPTVLQTLAAMPETEEPQITDPKSVEADPAEPRLSKVEAFKIEVPEIKPDQEQPAEIKPLDIKPVDTKPINKKPIDNKVIDIKTAPERAPVGRPALDHPALMKKVESGESRVEAREEKEIRENLPFQVEERGESVPKSPLVKPTLLPPFPPLPQQRASNRKPEGLLVSPPPPPPLPRRDAASPKLLVSKDVPISVDPPMLHNVVQSDQTPLPDDATLEHGTTEESGTFLSTEEGGLPRHRGAEELLLGGFLVMLAGSLKIQRIPAPWALYAVSCLIAIGLVTSIFGLLSNLSAQERRARWIKARGSILDQLGN